MSKQPSLKKYSGNCHCGAFKFSFEAPEPLTSAVECDCSICFKTGYIWEGPIDPACFVVEKGSIEELSSYEFSTKTVPHKFCPTCGTSVFARNTASVVPAERANKFFVNLRAVNNIDIYTLSLAPKLEFAQLDGAYVEPPVVSPSPDTPIPDGSRVYHGNCHCGAVRYAFIHAGPALTEARECNCSICSRDAAAWIYPPTTSVTFSPDSQSSITEYTFGRKRTYHGFCKLCGVAVYERFVGLNDAGQDRALRTALNTRTIAQSELDFGSLNLSMGDGRLVGGIYTVPE
ncbi:Glutathione-dependent formaldehyde-activating enzyme [Mycena chlorophos]|uniref:Glutathione-dependent formaldehyde-activating enzyme n=1 Tax=Mycena chlorophos TaxID=658473 RepID=A0A8H6SA72_MYCCL|nr:Glutathione-dependent formaldehyde-activating enzyme [Mycena chlorophos]